jgi:hypothetical protein
VRTTNGNLFSGGTSLFVGYGLPLFVGALVAGLTTLIFWIVQNYLL